MPLSAKEILDEEALSRRLYDPEPETPVFIEDDDETDIAITDVSAHKVATTKVRSTGDLEAALETLSAFSPESNPPSRRLRIISIHSESTLDPLQITRDAFQTLADRCGIDNNFLRIALAFGADPDIAESSNSFFSSRRQSSEDKTSTTSYLLNYVEENRRGGKNPWSWRHTGVFHRHATSFDIFVLLHPRQDNLLEQRLTRVIERDPGYLSSSPFDVHCLIFSTFLDNWRWFFKSLGEQFAHENNSALAANYARENPNASFSRVTALRNISDKMHRARACSKGNLTLIEKFASIHGDEIDSTWLETEREALTGYVTSSDGFIDRTRNAQEHVGYTLNLHNQLEIRDLNLKLNNMLKKSAEVDVEIRDLNEHLNGVIDKLKDLTEKTGEDSTTVKLITLVSAIYLPGSFVASMYGMNFFVFDQAARRIVIGKDFRICIVTWIPLTVLTGLVYAVVVGLDAKRKGKPMPWTWTRNQPAQPNVPAVTSVDNSEKGLLG